MSKSLLNLESQYEELRKKLLSGPYDGLLDRPISYWLRPSDSHMPSQVLAWPTRRLLTRSYTRLKAISGVGKAKIFKLCKLLDRVTLQVTSESSDRRQADKVEMSTTGVMQANAADRRDGFVNAPSDEVWDSLRRTVAPHRLSTECVGRFLPCLNDLSTTRWEEPLVSFAEMSLGELRSTPGVGEKTLRGILGVFWDLGQTLRQHPVADHLVVNIRPKFAVDIECWIRRKLKSDVLPDTEEILQEFVGPIIVQVAHDGDEQLADVIRARLGWKGLPSTLSQIGRDLKITQEAVRQKLVRVAMILSVRWPEGQYLIDDLCERLESTEDLDHERALAVAAFELFYPVRRRARISELLRHSQATGTNDAASHTELPGSSGKGAAVPSGQFIHGAILDLLSRA